MSAYQRRIEGIYPVIESIYPVNAQVAGEEFDRIYEKYGTINPEIIVDENRPEDAPLHECFEWDDAVAADKYRSRQARSMITWSRRLMTS